MLRRIRIYLVGVFLGCLMVYFSLIKDRNRDFTFWFPNDRVLEEITTSKLTYSDATTCKIKCLQITPEDLDLILQKGDVNFKQSKVDNKPKEYVIYWTNKANKKIKAIYQITDSENSKCISITTQPAVKCDCENNYETN